METVDFRRIGLEEGARVLDIGCGEGRHTLAAHVREASLAVGIDSDGGALRTARERAVPFHRSDPARLPRWIESSSNALPFSDGSFDFVLVCEVLEHLPEIDPTLREAHRVLRRSGRLAVSVPRFFPEWVCWKLSPAYHRTPGGHVRIFRESELRAALIRHGFRIRARHWAHAWHAPYWWLKCLWWDRPERSRVLRAYHRFLLWDLMKRPALSRWLERRLDPLLGKSLVLYAERT